MGKIKLLCVTGNCYPPKSGGEQAIFNAYKQIQDEVELHLFVICRDINEIDVLRTVLKDAHIYPYIRKRERFDVALGISKRLCNFIFRIGRVPQADKRRFLDVSFNLPERFDFYKELNSYIERQGIDIVQFEFIDWIFGRQGVIGNCKSVFVHHEIMHIADLPRLPKNRTVDDWLIYSIKKNREIIALNSYDAIITLSEDDKVRLMNAGVSVPIYPSFAQVSPLQFSPKQYNGTGDLVFIGPESHIPNKNGLLWFLENVWPQVLHNRPSTHLYVVGRWHEKTIELISSRHSNIVFLGFVDNLYENIRNRIVIVPIREGSGLRMKILDAINSGVPFVSCKVGAEGLKLENGVHGYITDDAAVFSRYVYELQINPAKCVQFVDNSIKHIASEFSNQQFVKSRLECYKSVLGGRSNA